LKGFAIAIVKTKEYRYNELRSELAYRIELLQQAGLGAGQNELLFTKPVADSYNM
jgi:hypothetical protein